MILFSLLCDMMMNPHVQLFMMLFARVKLNPWKTNFVMNGSQTLNALFNSNFKSCFFKIIFAFILIGQLVDRK